MADVVVGELMDEAAVQKLRAGVTVDYDSTLVDGPEPAADAVRRRGHRGKQRPGPDADRAQC